MDQLLIGPRASLTKTSTHSTLTLSPYFEATAGGEGSGSINPLVVDQLMLILTKNISEQDEVINIIMRQRHERNEQIEGGQDGLGVHAVPVPHRPDGSVLRVPYPCRSKLLLTTLMDCGRDGLGPSKAVSVCPSWPYRRLDR